MYTRWACMFATQKRSQRRKIERGVFESRPHGTKRAKYALIRTLVVDRAEVTCRSAT